jgi:hypothetical protein
MTSEHMKMDNFDAHLESFLAGCYTISNDHRLKHYPNCPEVKFKGQPGKRYVKVIRCDANGVGESVHCFVDKTNGDVLKAAGWAKPAKHARGNIFDDTNGLGRMGEYGPAYLR